MFKRNSLKVHMALSGLCKPLSMIISYLYIPIVLNYLGVEKYGIWATLLTLFSWVSFFDIGIGNGLRNKLTESLTQNDGCAKKLVSSAYLYIAIIMTGLIVLFIFISQFINWNKILGIKYEIDENIKIIVISCFVFVAVNFVMSLCKNIFFALQKSANVSFLEICVQLLNLLGVFILSKFSKTNLFLLTLVYGCSMLIVNFIANIVLYRNHNEVRPSVKYIDIYEGKKLTSLGIKFFIIQICALILFTTDNIIIANLYGSSYVTPYYTINKLYSAIIGVYTAFLVPVWSKVTKANISQKYMYIKKILLKLNIFIFPFILGSILLIFLFRPLMNFWLQQELEYSTVLIVFGSVYSILFMWCNTYSTFANGLELMDISLIVAIIQAIINIPLSLIFAILLKMESAGVLLGTICSMLVAVFCLPIAVLKKINGCKITGNN